MSRTYRDGWDRWKGHLLGWTAADPDEPIWCASCGRVCRARAVQSGTTIRCPRCGNAVMFPYAAIRASLLPGREWPATPRGDTAYPAEDVADAT